MPPAGADPCSLGSAVSGRDLWESSTDNKKPRTEQVRATIAHLSRLVERHAAGGYARAKALPEESPFGRPQTLKSDPLRQPAIDGNAENLWEQIVR